MSAIRLTQSFLCCVLVFQIIHVSPDVFFPDYSWGEGTRHTSTAVTRNPSVSPQSVTYIAKEQSFDSLILVGDVLLARNIEFLMNQKGASYPYKGLSFGTVARRPAVVGNFESSIPLLHVPTPMKQIRFSVSKSYIPDLALSGFTHLSLANNHSYDFTETGYNNTQDVLEKNQLLPIGHPNQLTVDAVEFIEVDDNVLAVIAANTLQQLPAYSELKTVLNYASARSDFQLVYVHWGSEYVPLHNSRQREAAERFVDAGADVVVGHHPHVVQDVELIDGVPVFYSLGNYVFDQYDSLDTQEGLMLHLELTGSQPKISLLPVTSVGTLSQPRFMTPENHAVFLEKLADRSDSELRKYITSGQILLDVQVASSSKVAMISQ